VAAARLAVAFVAAGTIAGATAWAQAGPVATPRSSAAGASLKANTVKSDDVVNGSLFFKDFHKGEVPSLAQFNKLQATTERFSKAAGKRFADASDLSAVKGEVGAVQGELGSYLKSADADARYLKAGDPVVHGRGSVFSDTRLITVTGQRVPVLEVPGLLTVEAENGKPRLFYVTNESDWPLTHTSCEEGGAFGSPAGVLQPGQHFHCIAGTAPSSAQLFGEGADPVIATLTVSAIPVGSGEDAQYTAQILVGT
jgi:hypothetical protein